MARDPLLLRLNELERRLWRRPESPARLDDVLRTQSEENARLIAMNEELDHQDQALHRLERDNESLLTSRLWRMLRTLGRLFSRHAVAPPQPNSPADRGTSLPSAPKDSYEQWRERFEGPYFHLLAERLPDLPAIPVTVIPLHAGEPLLRSLNGQSLLATQVLRASDSATLDKVLLQPYDGLVILVAGDGLLSPHALATLLDHYASEPEADLFYADEDSLSPDGHRTSPFFKPDWSPDLLLSQNYTGSLLAFTPALARRLQSPSGVYDAMLQLSRHAQRISHVPHVLFHRQEPTPAAPDQEALQQHLQRVVPAARVEAGVAPGRWRVRYPVPAGKRVSILIPTGGRVEVLDANLDALLHRTTFQDFEVAVIDNSARDEIWRYLQSLSLGNRLRYLDFRGHPFQYARLNNAAARECDSPYLLFLNDDTEALQPDWLDAMLELAARPEVGAVGAKLIYPDGRLQHAGIVMGLFHQCGHAFRTLRADKRHYFDLPDSIRNVSAVTAACLMTRADVFWEVGGFDEQKFPVAYNDVDLCLRIGRAGYRVLYTPYAVLRHHEAYSKSEELFAANSAESNALQRRWAEVIEQDPFYSPHLARDREDYEINQEPKAQAPTPR